MPLDSLSWTDADFKRRCIGWKLKYSLIPRRCHYTKKLVWFKFAYFGVGLICGPGDPVYDYRWCERHEYLFLKIKGIL
jgi:hypothetical protein